MSVLDLEELLPRLRNSAPGPDGIQYAAYVAVPDLAIALLMGLYETVLCGGVPPRGFNASLLAFLAKGSEEADSKLTAR